MAWPNVQVDRQMAGRWHIKQVVGAVDTYEVVNPAGVVAATWWPTEKAMVPSAHGLLCELAHKLNDMRDLLCPNCQGELPCRCNAEAVDR